MATDALATEELAPLALQTPDPLCSTLIDATDAREFRAVTHASICIVFVPGFTVPFG